MSQDRDHGVGLICRLLDVLHDLTIAERPLGKRSPIKLHVGLIPYNGRTRTISGATLLTWYAPMTLTL